jgi:hypothetical protein
LSSFGELSKAMDFQNKRVQLLLFIAGIIALSITGICVCAFFDSLCIELCTCLGAEKMGENEGK